MNNCLSFLMFSAILAVAGVILSIFLVCVIVTVIKKVSTPSTIDVLFVKKESTTSERVGIIQRDDL